MTDAYRFIAAEKANYPISLMSRMLGVNRQAFHAWERRPPSQRALEDAFLTERIREIHRAARGVYGARRIHAELRLGHGIRVSRKRVEWLMRQAGISGLVPRKRGRTTIRVPGVRVADDLVKRDFRPGGPNVLWVADITYLRSWEGWVYLAAVQDAFSRTIVGWAMAEHMRAGLVVDALQMALTRRKPQAELIHHSDQGLNTSRLPSARRPATLASPSRWARGATASDNAVAESFFATLKKELVCRRSWPNRRDLQSAVFDYIESFYNRERRHSTLGYLSPREFKMISTHQQRETEKVKP